MNEWFRSWHGAPTDPKWLGIAKRVGVAPGIVAAIAWALMDRASQARDRGSIEGYDADGLAAFFGCEPEQVDSIVSVMTDRGMIRDGQFSSWEKRQPKREDNSSERVKAHRERKKEEVGGDETQCNAQKPPVTLDTDTDTDGLLTQSLGETPSKPRKRATQIPDDFLPSEAVLDDHQIDILTPDEVSRQVERMIDWAKSKGETRKDWNAFARGWLRKEADQKRDRLEKRQANGYNTRDSITQAFDYIDRRDVSRSQDGGQENPELLPRLREASA